MKLKANLHFHSSEDSYHGDGICYSLFDGIDYANSLGFNVLGSTCHRTVVCTSEHIKYAKEKGILLIPGIEADIYNKDRTSRNHVVILNCDKSIEEVVTFKDLEKYKNEHPDIFVIAPHPFLYEGWSLGPHLEEFIYLFDAIENSWFYSEWYNINKKAKLIADKYNKPFISTSDTHIFDFMNKSYTNIEAEKNTTTSFFQAIKKHKIKNTTSKRSLIYDMLWKGIILILYADISHKVRSIKK